MERHDDACMNEVVSFILFGTRLCWLAASVPCHCPPLPRRSRAVSTAIPTRRIPRRHHRRHCCRWSCCCRRHRPQSWCCRRRWKTASRSQSRPQSRFQSRHRKNRSCVDAPRQLRCRHANAFAFTLHTCSSADRWSCCPCRPSPPASYGRMSCVKGNSGVRGNQRARNHRHRDAPRRLARGVSLAAVSAVGSECG